MTGALAGRTILVTGGTRGIGLAIAAACLRAGAAVAITGRDAETGACARARLARDGPVRFHACDLRDAARTEALTRALRADGPAVTDLVCNAGIGGRRRGDGPIDECAPAAWDDVIATNLTGAFHAMRAAMADLLRARGAVVAISSVAGVVGTRESFGAHAYAASKAGLIGLTRAVAAQYGARGVRANCLLPGPVEPGAAAAQTRGDPFTGRHADVAAACAFLLSPDAAHVNGVALPVDGGFLAH